MHFLKTYWFMLGLVGVTFLAVGDPTVVTVNAGLWLKHHHGPDLVITLIFFLSGLALDTRQVRSGVKDYQGTVLALLFIFVAAPMLAALFHSLQLPTEIMIGLFLVAAMPTTLSSGVVMSGAAGGNMAHALLITIIANGLAVLTIPFTLSMLLSMGGESREIVINQLPIMLKIATVVLLPLAAGLIVRNTPFLNLTRLLPYTSTCNQLGILVVVWMGACQGRNAILSSLDSILPIILLTFMYHLVLLAIAGGVCKVMGIGKGRREGVILMGCQKTLPLSIILQVSLFPDYGIALVVCVLHHITHLAMDAFLVQYLRKAE